MADGIALVGAGTWGRNWLRVLLSETETRLRAVVDPDAAALGRVEAAAREAARPMPLLLGDARDLVRLDDVAGAVIAGPIPSHVELARLLVESGRHVLVEKPMAASRAAAAGLVVLAEEKGVSLAVGHTFLYSAGAEAFRDVLVSGRLGELRFISAERANFGRFGPRFGPLWELAVHDVALLLWWFGPARVVRVGCFAAPSRRPPLAPEDICVMSVGLSGGLEAFLQATWRSPVKVRRTLASGSRGMALYEELPGGPAVTVYPVEAGAGAREPAYPRGEGWPLPPRAPGEDPLTLEFRDWRRSWTSGGALRTGAAEALKVVTVLEAATLSALRGGAPVSPEEVAG